MQSSKLEIKWPNKLVREIIHVYMYISLSLPSPVYSALSYIVRCTCAFFLLHFGLWRTYDTVTFKACRLFGLFALWPLRPSLLFASSALLALFASSLLRAIMPDGKGPWHKDSLDKDARNEKRELVRARQYAKNLSVARTQGYLLGQECNSLRLKSWPARDPGEAVVTQWLPQALASVKPVAGPDPDLPAVYRDSWSSPSPDEPATEPAQPAQPEQPSTPWEILLGPQPRSTPPSIEFLRQRSRHLFRRLTGRRDRSPSVPAADGEESSRPWRDKKAPKLTWKPKNRQPSGSLCKINQSSHSHKYNI